MRWASPPERVAAARSSAQVVQAHIEQEAEPGVDLLDDPLGDLPLAVGEVDVIEERRGILDRQRRDVRDRAATDEVTASDSGLSRLPPHCRQGICRMKPS
jgi:hypothetical protein